MESNRTQTATYQQNGFEFAGNVGENDDVEARLNDLLALNRETANRDAIFQTQQERFEANIMENPIRTERAFALFGLMLGAFPPFAMFSKFMIQNLRNSDGIWIIFLLLFVNIICATVGYFSGRLVGKMAVEVEKYSWTAMLLVLPFMGILWGIMAGGAGGIFIFIIGAFFGAAMAAMVGAVAFPVFGIFHRWLKKGDVIERDQFLPIAMGITFIIAALFFGLPMR